jgi:uncharacterized membrane protein YecN with MAPEG domain
MKKLFLYYAIHNNIGITQMTKYGNVSNQMPNGLLFILVAENNGMDSVIIQVNIRHMIGRM